jgi:CubicO group peptidase (beta-lactamase class C family)
MDKKDIMSAVDGKCSGTIMDNSEKGLLESPLKPSNTIASKAAYHLSSLSTRLATGLTFICLTVAAIHYFAPAATTFPSVNLNFFPWDPPTCPAPKPNIFGYHPPRPSNPEITKATKGLDGWLTKTVAQTGIDSLSIAVVTAAGPIFQKGYGVLRANESVEEQKPVDTNSVYRIASISKMFTVLETLILRERGILNWYEQYQRYTGSVLNA